jgi:hypothetical protein
MQYHRKSSNFNESIMTGRYSAPSPFLVHRSEVGDLRWEVALGRLGPVDRQAHLEAVFLEELGPPIIDVITNRATRHRQHECSLGLLPGHGDSEALLVCDHVVEVLGGVAEIDLDPFDGAVEGLGAAVQVVGDTGRGVGPAVCRLIPRENTGNGRGDGDATNLGARSATQRSSSRMETIRSERSAGSTSTTRSSAFHRCGHDPGEGLLDDGPGAGKVDAYVAVGVSDELVAPF